MNANEFIELLSFKPKNITFETYDKIHMFEFHLRDSNKHIANIEFPEKQDPNDRMYIYLEILDMTDYEEGSIITNANVRKVSYLKWLEDDSDEEYTQIAQEIDKIMADYDGKRTSR